MWSVCRSLTTYYFSTITKISNVINSIYYLCTTHSSVTKIRNSVILYCTTYYYPLQLLKLGIQLSCTVLHTATLFCKQVSHPRLFNHLQSVFLLSYTLLLSLTAYYVTILSTYNLQSIRVQICFSKAVANNKRVFPVILLQLSLAKKHKRGKDEVNCPPPLNIKSYHHEKIRHSRPDT